MQNLLLVTSNLYALRALLAWSVNHANGLPQILTSSAMLASMAYHAVERRRHRLPGLVPCMPSRERLLHNVDRAAALGLSLFLAWRVYAHGKLDLLPSACAALFVNGLSEVFYFFPQLARSSWWYTVLHSSWHVMAFHLCYRVANF